MTPSQAAQEKPTGPRPPLEDALRELIRVSKGAGMNAASDFGYMPSQQQADEEEISEAVQAVYAAIEREAAAATPSLDARGPQAIEALDRIQRAVLLMGRVAAGGTLVTESVVVNEAREALRDFHALARLDEGSATPDQGKGEPR